MVFGVHKTITIITNRWTVPSSMCWDRHIAQGILKIHIPIIMWIVRYNLA